MYGGSSRARRWVSWSSTLGRLYASTYYALRDTRTPLALRHCTCDFDLTVLGYVCALRLPGWIGLNPSWGAAGLTASNCRRGLRLGRVHFIASRYESPHRDYRTAGVSSRKVVVLRGSRRCDCVGHQAFNRTSSSDCERDPDSRAVRSCLFWNHLLAWSGRMRKRIPEICAIAAIKSWGASASDIHATGSPASPPKNSITPNREVPRL